MMYSSQGTVYNRNSEDLFCNVRYVMHYRNTQTKRDE